MDAATFAMALVNGTARVPGILQTNGVEPRSIIVTVVGATTIVTIASSTSQLCLLGFATEHT